MAARGGLGSTGWYRRKRAEAFRDRQGEETSMRNYMTPLMAFGALAFVVIGGLPQSGIKPLHAQTPAKEDGPRAADAEPAPFNPQLGALMSMIIQPRHAKL